MIRWPTISRRKVIALFCVIALAVGVVWLDHWAILEPCERPVEVEEHGFPKDLPIGLRSALIDKFGEIVPPGKAFDATDVAITGKNRRAIFVWSRERRWIVATQHGGLVHNEPVFAFDVLAGGVEAKLVATEIAFPNSVCATAVRLMGS